MRLEIVYVPTTWGKKVSIELVNDSMKKIGIIRRQEDAVAIKKAVNMHKDLMRATKFLLQIAQESSDLSDEEISQIQSIKAFITKEEGE